MAKIPIGLQLFSVRGECQRDLPNALAQIARIGYQGVEPWGYNGEEEAWQGVKGPELRKMLDDLGLRCCGMHCSTGAFQGDNLERTIALNRALGNHFLIDAGDRTRMASRDGIQELADILNEAAGRAKSEGMQVGYHAHPFDFVTHDGELAWDILFGSTRPEVVMQMDTGNCVAGGGDPVAELRKFPGRARTVHVKEYGGAPGATIGEGGAPWAEIFRLCEEDHATEWYVVEEGSDDGMGFDIPRRSLEGLHRLGK